MSKQFHRQPTKRMRRRERKEERQRENQARLTANKRNVMMAGIIACIVAVGIAFGVRAFTSPSGSASTDSTVQCNVSEQGIYHIHAHLSTYIDEQRVLLPKNIGITRSCIYWLHTHDPNGIVHVEAPKQDTFTLGTFLQFWRQQVYEVQYPIEFTSTQGWKVYVNGKPYSGDFNHLKLSNHLLITLAYNSPHATPDKAFNWGQL